MKHANDSQIPAYARQQKLTSPKMYFVLAACLAVLLITIIFLVNCVVTTATTTTNEPAETAPDTLVATEASDDTHNNPGGQELIEVSDAELTMDQVDYSPEPSQIDRVSASSGLQTFSLSGLDEPTLSDSEQQAIQTAIDAIETDAPTGFIVYNVKTGKGISYNVDDELYAASSYKAPYALYVCETKVETGELTLPGVGEAGENTYFGQGSYVKGLIIQSITYSDNDSFMSLRRLYDSEGYDEWINSLGVYDAPYISDSDFPWYSVRSSVKIWTEMYNYLESGSEAAAWLGELCADTNRSFIRNALAGYSDLYVQNKAGWCSGTDWYRDYNSVSDAGIVTIGEDKYVVSFMSNLTDTESHFYRLQELIAAVFDARAELDF